MDINVDKVKEAINGDADALGNAFHWKWTEQGYKYWSDQYCGLKPIDVDTLREMIGEDESLKVGETYTSINSMEWECIFVRDGIAWMMLHDSPAYRFNAKTGENISQGGGSYNITFNVTRSGTVEYIDGKPDFDTWTPDD